MRHREAARHLRLSRFHDRRIAHGHIRTTDEPACRLSFRPALRITRMAKRNADLRRQRALERLVGRLGDGLEHGRRPTFGQRMERSEEHTSELQSLMRNSYAVFCLKKKKKTHY